jgi:hypothetical protein
VATLSPGGVPHLAPLRFLYDGRTIHALPGAATPTVRHLREQQAVVLLLDAEQTTGRVLRVRAHATIRSEQHLMRRYKRRAAAKYFLRPGGLWNTLTHWRLFLGGRRLRRDNALIEFVPQTAELVPRPPAEDRAKKDDMCRDPLRLKHG